MSVRQIVYTMVLNFLTTGGRLFKKDYVRTIDKDSNGNRVDIGRFNTDGLQFNNWDNLESLRYNIAVMTTPLKSDS